MALLWCDGFDHYNSSTHMLDGVYAEISGFTMNTTNPRTGARCAQLNLIGVMRRVLGGAKTTVGLGGAFYYSALPGSNNNQRLFEFRDAANGSHLGIILQSTGTISAIRDVFATNVILGTTASPVITANAYQFVECMVTFSNTVGTVEVRVNGVTVLSLSGVDTVNTANVECSQVLIGGGNGGSGVSHQIDDIYAIDNTGTYNNTFIGDRRVLTIYPNANTATADWTAVGAATGYECIDEATPDDDTTYITSSTTGHVSQFGLQNLPAGISLISAVVMVERARKTEAGTANTQVSIVSGASTANGADKPLTEVYTYRQDVFETDPATAAPFTPSAVDSLQFKVTRTA